MYEYEYTSRSLPVQNQFVTQQGDPTNLPSDRENFLIFFNHRNVEIIFT